MIPSTFLLSSIKAQKFVRLVELREVTYIKSLCNKIDCTYSHAVKIVSDLKQQEIFIVEKSGAKSYISLTPKGKRIAKIINELHYEMGIFKIK